jgi:hypothetical protein
MSWWKRLWGGGTAPSSPDRLDAVRLAMPGWMEEASSGHSRVWRDSQGDVLSLSVPEASLVLPEISNEVALQQWCRQLAESRHGGMFDVSGVTGALGGAVGLIYKRLQKPAYIFTGMLIVPRQEGSQVWTIVAGEHGTTGVREAVITAELMNAGALTIDDYERSWAQDPYEPAYRGVDRSVLRFVSDDECYDERFSDHPLSKVRQVLATLPYSVQVESRAPEL